MDWVKIAASFKGEEMSDLTVKEIADIMNDDIPIRTVSDKFAEAVHLILESEMNEVLYQINSPYYTAGVIVSNGIIIDSAPILKWTRGKSEIYCFDYFKRKGFKFLRVT